LSLKSILISYVQSQQHVWQKIPQWCKKHSSIWNEKQGDAINVTLQWPSNLGLKSFNTYQKPYIKCVNVKIFANKIEEHRELGEVQCSLVVTRNPCHDNTRFIKPVGHRRQGKVKISCKNYSKTTVTQFHSEWLWATQLLIPTT